MQRLMKDGLQFCPPRETAIDLQDRAFRGLFTGLGVQKVGCQTICAMTTERPFHDQRKPTHIYTAILPKAHLRTVYVAMHAVHRPRQFKHCFIQRKAGDQLCRVLPDPNHDNILKLTQGCIEDVIGWVGGWLIGGFCAALDQLDHVVTHSGKSSSATCCISL